MRWRLETAALLAGLLLAIPAAAREIRIGGGVPGGVYAALAGSICRLVNAESERHGLQCLTVPSPGAVGNARDLRDGDVEIAILQADIARDLMNGVRPFLRGGGFSEARLLFHGHHEALAIVARGGIADVDDLRGMTIDAGSSGSATRLLVWRLLEEAGLLKDALPHEVDLPLDRQWRDFCAGRIDAMAYVAGQPNGLIEEAVAGCGGRLLPLPAALVEPLVARFADYHATEISAGLYDAGQPAVPTIGVDALVVGSTRLSEPEAYEVTAAVLGGVQTLRRLHPAFATMTAGEMARGHDGVPMHPGAARYIAEKGLR